VSATVRRPVAGPAPASSPPPSTAPPVHDLPVLESYRALAAVLVLLTHVGFNTGAAIDGPWAGWLARGDAGVAVFFVLSGFLLFRPWVAASDGRRPRVRIAEYLWRRAVRLLPAYAAALLGLLVLVPSSRSAGPERWLLAGTLTSIYGSAPLLPGFTQTWSLGTEVSFYLALPLLAALWLGRRPPPRAARRALAAASALALAALGWRVAVPLLAEHGNPLYWLPGYLDWFGAGMGLAWLREHQAGGRWAAMVRSSAAAPGAWVALAVTCYWLSTTSLAGPYSLLPPTLDQIVVKHLLYLGFATALLIPAVFGDPESGWQRRLRSPALVWAGTVSYGFFLWHMIVLTALHELLHVPVFEGYFVPVLLAVAVLGGLAAAASWHFLEHPLQNRLRSLPVAARRRQAGS
jgi:peptidoglycan/LPS O-acetylase OafA/YrhL